MPEETTQQPTANITMTPAEMTAMIAQAIVATQNTGAKQQTEDPNKPIVPMENPEFAGRVREMEMERKRTIVKAARKLDSVLPDNFDMDPSLRCMTLAKYGLLDWTYHRNRNRFDIVSNMKNTRLQRGYSGADREIEDLETQMDQCIRIMEDIEILATAAEMQFDQAVQDHLKETGQEYNGVFRFDISDQAFAAWLEKDATQRTQNNQRAAAAGRTGDDALRRAGVSNRLERLAATGSVDEEGEL